MTKSLTFFVITFIKDIKMPGKCKYEYYIT